MEKNTKKETGEETAVKRKGYRLLFIEPCMSDKKKKMAEATISRVPHDISRVRLPGYAADYSAELKILRLTRGKLSVILFADGNVSIRNAEDGQQVVEIMEQLLQALR